ncbi:MAG: peptidylprolyl isomerase [Thermoplasmatota archaeon]
MASKKSRRRRSNPEIKKSFLERKEVKTVIFIIAVIFLVAVSIIVISNINDNGIVDQTENPIAIIDTTMGVIKVELYEDLTPNTVDNFIKLAEDGFYDGLVFHRVIENFMIQGGGFYTDGTPNQSPYGPIDLEIHPEASHVNGAIAMARTSDPNSATSQFFINHGSQPSLEPGGVDQYGYAVFGVTIEGFEIVSSIASLPTTNKFGMDDWPVDDVIINSITIETQ